MKDASAFRLLKAPRWKDYELFDSGGFEKLERFGPYYLIRPEPQALWDPSLSAQEWRELAHAHYRAKTSTSGEWEKYKPMPADWQIGFSEGDLNVRFHLHFTAFKHVGVFPEQAANWTYLYHFLKNCGVEKPRVLNLFSYTGGASLAAKAAGADVIHLDSVKQVVNWARENMELSRLDGIRWVVEDAAKFAAREARRGNRYHAVIMDPPSYGLGPKGERWKLEDHLNEMMKNVLSLLEPQAHAFIINTYSLNLSALLLKNLVHSSFPKAENLECGELYVESRQGQELPLGSYLRFSKSGK
jgi:23S rRNA (cytosine1962-C5)-methyltransferase